MTIMKKILVLLALLVPLWACQSQSVYSNKGTRDAMRGTGSPFVEVDGTEFVRNGEPYYFVGANFWYGAYLGATAEGRTRLAAELDQLSALGVSNLRVLAASEKTALTMAVSPAIHTAPGEFNENLLRGLDVLLDEMGKRDMVAVLYLNNFWQWSGGMSQYMSWATGEAPFDPDVTGDWNGFMQNSAAFYRSEQAQNWYQDLIEAVVTRTNTVNGIAYVDDPTIMAWQLANEPRPGSDADGRPFFDAYKNWIETTVDFIKSLDSNHLVSTGSEGAMGSLRDIDLYREAHENTGVDYLTFHMWPKNWGWFDVKKPQQTYRSAMTTSKAYILQHLQVAKALNMPTVLEEFGIERDSGNYSLESGTTQRDRFYSELFAFLERQAELGEPIAGSNFWTWGGAGRAQEADFIWRTGDPFTGDPPQEHQGLNSVFDMDRSTLKVIGKHARFMNAL